MKKSQGRKKILEASIEPRVEITTPTSRKNMVNNHPPKQIIGSKDKGVMTRRRVNEELCLISQVEPKSADEACKGDHGIQAMKEELDKIVKNETWNLVPIKFLSTNLGTDSSFIACFK